SPPRRRGPSAAASSSRALLRTCPCRGIGQSRTLGFASLALGQQRLQVRVVVGLVYHMHVEEHCRMVRATQLRALPGKYALRRWPHLEVVVPTGDDIQLLVKRRHPERVDHIWRREVELDQLADWKIEVRGFVDGVG